jgi:cytosine deaminase
MARGKVIARRERSPMRLQIAGREAEIDRRFNVPGQG